MPDSVMPQVVAEAALLTALEELMRCPDLTPVTLGFRFDEQGEVKVWAAQPSQFVGVWDALRLYARERMPEGKRAYDALVAIDPVRYRLRTAEDRVRRLRDALAMQLHVGEGEPCACAACAGIHQVLQETEPHG